MPKSTKEQRMTEREVGAALIAWAQAVHAGDSDAVAQLVAAKRAALAAVGLDEHLPKERDT